MPQAARWRATLAGVIGFHVALTLACFATAAVVSPGWAAWAYELAAAEMAAAATLLATWVALGPGSTLRRLCYGIAYGNLLLTLQLVAALVVGSDGPTFGAMERVRTILGTAVVLAVTFGLPATSLTALLFAARDRGWRWTDEPVADDSRGGQFALRELLGATLLIALACGAARLLSTQLDVIEPWRETLREPPGVWMTCFGFPLTLVLSTAYHAGSVAACAGPRTHLLRLVAAPSGAYLAGLAMWFVLVMLRPPLDLRIGVGAATSAGLTVAYLLAFRAAGWRIDRAPRGMPV